MSFREINPPSRSSSHDRRSRSEGNIILRDGSTHRSQDYNLNSRKKSRSTTKKVNSSDSRDVFRASSRDTHQLDICPLSPSSTSTTSYDSSSSGDEFSLNENQHGSLRRDDDTIKVVSADIVLYQKNISSLGQIIYSLNGDQAELWKCRLQIEANEKLGKKINEALKSLEREIQHMMRNDATKARSTYVKLKKDFSNVKASFKNLKLEFKRRQHISDMELLEKTNNNKTSQLSNNESDDDDVEMGLRLKTNDSYEEFVMRERESEVKQINQKMHQVNDIYKDLGQIVHSQQEQIDKVEEIMDDARGLSKSGLNHIEKANKPGSYVSMFNKKEDEQDERQSSSQKTPRGAQIKECSWLLPLEEYGFDVRGVREDLLDFSNDMVEVGKHTYNVARTSIMAFTAHEAVNEKMGRYH